jgi:acetamidase/formamidase
VDNSIAPALTIESGETVALACEETCGGQMTPDATLDFVKTDLDFHKVSCLTGPIAMAGAEPGDVLEVEIVDFEHFGWAWTTVYPNFGLLAQDFGDTYGLHIWKVEADGYAGLTPQIRIPIEPFCGEIGVALSGPGAHSSLPPRHVGGNLDTRHICTGTTLFLPVEVPGALFSAGDCHLAQGDGEVCGTALEAPAIVTCRFTLRKDLSLERPQFRTTASTTAKYDDMGYYATGADHIDVGEAIRNAVRDMITYLERAYALTATEAYMLCSCAGDLKVSVPNLGPGHASFVTFHMPRNIFSN